MENKLSQMRYAFLEDTKKPRTRQEELELEARIALTQAHQKARKQAKEERNRNRRGSVSSLERIVSSPSFYMLY